MYLNNTKVGYVIVLIVLICSCKTVQKSKTADFDYINITKNGIYQKPLVTDLNVSAKKEVLDNTYTDVTSVEQAKENALGDFIQRFQCDLIVHPMFEVNTEAKDGINKKISVRLSGYPATFKNIRTFELKDTSSFMFYGYKNSVAINTMQPKINPINSAAVVVTQILSGNNKKKNGGFGLEAFAALPSSDLRNYYKTGYGANMFARVDVANSVYINVLNLSYAEFAGKSYYGGSFGYTYEKLGILSDKIGVGYISPVNAFAEVNIGASYPLSGIQNEKFAFANNFILGYQFGKGQLKIIFENSGNDIKYTGLALGFRF